MAENIFGYSKTEMIYSNNFSKIVPDINNLLSNKQQTKYKRLKLKTKMVKNSLSGFHLVLVIIKIL